ncbi:hypothetical protein RGQ29_010683 [Quercus rubra]|uniref:HpcH/HpaI aldolase/citrate lyase domain-containing protein n=1 Tax=Quercus rubra TaxID=3512 RepID=A0AAN7FVU8_QUERU|nr:hypothetical protein RGQ29_010683 [Quercus rubra]
MASSATPQTLRARLNKANEEPLLGLFCISFSPTLAEIAGHAGYDFVVIDMEHGHGGISDALPCLQALAATQTPAILRIPENSAAWVKKALDVGPQGIMIPMVDDAELAKNAVSYCRYPPNGIRGAAHNVVRASKYGIDEEYINKCEKELLIMCQVESMEAVKNVKDIAAVEGVDCVMIGPLDLSASMGWLKDPVNEKVKEVMRVAEKTVFDSESKTYLAGFAMPNDGPDELKRRGYHMVCGNVDVALFKSAAVEDVKKFKMN